MITILKETPITFNGEDCLEVLVHDDNIVNDTPCGLCMYRDYMFNPDIMASCMDVHGCTICLNTYFITKPL
jgi:hypothetical protein